MGKSRAKLCLQIILLCTFTDYRYWLLDAAITLVSTNLQLCF